MFDVISVGSCTVDAFAKTEKGMADVLTNKKGVEELAYPLGEKILIKDLRFQIGGSGANTSIGFSRLGLHSAVLSKIGKDVDGSKIFKKLKEENVSFIGNLGKISAYSVVLNAIKRDRTILTYRGCTNNIKYKNIDFKKFKTKYVFFGSLMKQSLKTMKKIAKYCDKNNIKKVFNPSSYLAKKRTRYLKPILDNCEALILNKEEAKLLSKKDTGRVKKLLKTLKQKGPKIVVITDGKDGVYLLDNEGDYYHAYASKKIKIEETTGAGDAFNTGFTTGLILKKELEECIKMGLCNAESVIRHYGAQKGLLKQKQLNRKLKKDKRKIVKTKL